MDKEIIKFGMGARRLRRMTKSRLTSLERVEDRLLDGEGNQKTLHLILKRRGGEKKESKEREKEERVKWLMKTNERIKENQYWRVKSKGREKRIIIFL